MSYPASMHEYRDDLDAARIRIGVLEARLAERDAELEARDAALRAREEELRAVLRLQPPAAEAPPSGRTARWGALVLGMMALTLSVGVSEAFDRVGRAERALTSAQREMRLAQADNDFAIASLRAEAGRLRRALVERGATLEAVDLPLSTEEKKERLLDRLATEHLEEDELELLRHLCSREHDGTCLERLERHQSL